MSADIIPGRSRGAAAPLAQALLSQIAPAGLGVVKYG